MSFENKYRVHEVAKDFGKQTKDITQILTTYATAPKNHMQVLSDKELSIVFEYMTQHNQVADMQASLATAPKGGENRKGSQLVIQVWVSAGEETGEMPDLKNQTLQDARILLEKLNKEYNLELTVEAPEELKQFSEEITEGYVIKTEPAQGEILKKGDTVKLILSKGPDIKPVTVLPFVGMSIDSVLSQLESYKLTCDAADVEVVDSDKPGGTIVWQSPASGETVPEWTTIKFRVSAGLASSALPITVDIPQNGKDIVKVEIYVGDEPNPQYSETVYEADGAVSTTLYGTGRKMVKVYFDGVLDQKQSYERSFG